MRIRREETELFVFINDMIFYAQPQEIYKKSSKCSGYKIDMQHLTVFWYTSRDM